MRRVLLAVVIAGAWFVAAEAKAVFACSCGARAAADALTDAGIDAVFVGRVTSEPNRSPAPGFSSAQRVTWEFEVEEVYRGELPAVIEVKSAISEASCGFEHDAGLGGRLGLTVYDDDGTWQAGLCDQVDPAALRSVGIPRAPLPVAGADAGKSGWGLPIGVGGAVFGLGILTLVVITRRHRPGPAAP